MSIPAAIITKHDFLTKLEEHTRSPENLQALQRLFENPKHEDTLNYFGANGLLTADELDLVRTIWLRDDGAFDRILPETEAGFCNALASVSAERPLSCWLVIGAIDEYAVHVLVTDRNVLLQLLVPSLPKPSTATQQPGTESKVTLDPAFRKHVDAARDKLEALAPPESSS